MTTQYATKQYLIRSYYFAEAMALYELYYRPLVETYAPARTELVDPGRAEDRPPTWVPLVFHCTTMDHVPAIVERGAIEVGDEGTVSFSELPIGELDRMKYRHHGSDQVAFGFPRRFLESVGFAPVLYAKHHSRLRETLRQIQSSRRDLYERLAPFVETSDDVSPFQEIRTTSAVPIEMAVWVLTTKRKGEPSRPDVLAADAFRERYGRIPTSYWHRTHQMEMLGEWQYVNLTAGDDGWPREFNFVGEYYWTQSVGETKRLKVSLPKHDRRLEFALIDPEKRLSHSGPWHFVDVARILFDTLRRTGEQIDDLLPYRLIREFDSL